MTIAKLLQFLLLAVGHCKGLVPRTLWFVMKNASRLISASVALVREFGKRFMLGECHITCKALFESLINTCVLSVMKHSLAFISDPSLEGNLCNNPRMIGFHSS